MTWLDAVGWAGSVLLIVSLMQARVMRFRVLNLVACVVLVGFNAAIAVWPMVGMNIVLAAINVWFIVRLLAERRTEGGYAVLQVDADDTYLQHFLATQREDIRRFFPDVTGVEDAHGRTAYLVLRGHETIGVVLVRDEGNGLAQVELDYVTPRFRDLSPGEFVFRRSGLFRERGFRRVLTAPGMVAPYYERLGFTPAGPSWALDVS